VNNNSEEHWWTENMRKTIATLKAVRYATVTVYRVVLHKASYALRPLLFYTASPSEFKSFLIQPEELW
jgi:hypothetical protein